MGPAGVGNCELRPASRRWPRQAISCAGALPVIRRVQVRVVSRRGQPADQQRARAVTRRRHDRAGRDRPRDPAPGCGRALRSLTQWSGLTCSGPAIAARPCRAGAPGAA